MLAAIRGCRAFPLLDATEGQVPFGSELAAPDAQDLQHQLQLVNGLSAPLGGGWTIIPRIDLQEELTDNVLQAHAPRRFDLGDPDRHPASPLRAIRRACASRSISHRPCPCMPAPGNLNSLTEQMSGIGNVTIVPDLAFVDIRAVSGVNSLNGGLGGQGTVGASSHRGDAAERPSRRLPATGQGLNRNNEVQTSSFGISPYLMHRFGDWGTGRLGASVAVSQSNALSGFAASPFPTGGANAQTLVTTEQTAHFVTGDFMQFVQDAFDIDLMQTQTTIGTGVIDSANRRAAADNAAFVINPNHHYRPASPIRSTAASHCSCQAGTRIFTTPRRPSPSSGHHRSTT